MRPSIYNTRHRAVGSMSLNSNIEPTARCRCRYDHRKLCQSTSTQSKAAEMKRPFTAFLLWTALNVHLTYASPTDGFVQQTLNDSNLAIQKPYDMQLSQRYNFTDGVHHLWVYKGDKPFQRGSNTAPRTEIRITGYDYTSEVWQYEGDFYVPEGTSGVCIMQVFGGDIERKIANTSLQLRVYDGELKRYRNESVASEMYEKWFHLNVIHDADLGKVYVFINQERKLVANDRGKANHYFKCGVYAQDNPSDRMESRWKNIKIWKKETNHASAIGIGIALRFFNDPQSIDDIKTSMLEWTNPMRVKCCTGEIPCE
eukprot:Gb_26348 [translate_table: standard]